MKIKNKICKGVDVFINKNLIAYQESLDIMEKRVLDLYNDRARELIWLLEHTSVYTSGRGHKEKRAYINDVPVINCNRGGKITWHGPGQKVIYLVLNLRKRKLDIRKFVHALEEFIIQSLSEMNIFSYRKKNLIGIWTKDTVGQDAQIASLGLRVSKGIIYHGLSINFSCNLENFYKINPCGISNGKVTSIKSLNNQINIEKCDSILEKNISNII